MLLKTRGVIKITEEGEPFTNENGEMVKWYKAWFKDSQSGDVHELTSGSNYEEYEGEDVIITLKAVKQYQAKGYKLNIYAVEKYTEDIVF